MLVNYEVPTLKGSLPIGGESVGPDSFARQITWQLSQAVNNHIYGDRLEIQFLSLNGLDGFRLDGEHRPSLNEFSMFRLLDKL